MDIFLSIIAWFGCWSAMMVNAPEYLLINTINQSSEGKLSYFFIKLMKRSYNLIFLIFLNLFCFITQFFVLSQDLKFVLFVINIMFFINTFWDILINSYNKNYIALLQSKLVSPVKLLDMFEVETNCNLPNQYNSNGIYILIKNKIYYKDESQRICLTPKKLGMKKSPIKLGEIKFIVSQLNEKGIKFSDNIEVNSFYKHNDLYEYSDYFVFDEVKNNKFRRMFYKCIPLISEILNSIFLIVYFGLGVLSIASAFGSNWCSWFTL